MLPFSYWLRLAVCKRQTNAILNKIIDLFHNEIISFCLRKATIKLAAAGLLSSLDYRIEPNFHPGPLIKGLKPFEYKLEFAKKFEIFYMHVVSMCIVRCALCMRGHWHTMHNSLGRHWHRMHGAIGVIERLQQGKRLCYTENFKNACIVNDTTWPMHAVSLTLHAK
jgi:hypothetical protein